MTRRVPALRFIMLITLVALTWNCAREERPSGGPPDQIPPRITEISPQPGATNVGQRPEIRITFSEGMKSASIPRSVQAIPPLGRFSVEQLGDTYLIQPNDTLRTNQTYVLTITGYTDRHNVPQDSIFTLAFSTGDQLDKGRIWGMLRGDDRNIQNAEVYLYDRSDTTETPRYRTQSNNDGQFELNYLKFGEYRLLAFKEKTGDQKFEFGNEAGADTVITLSDDQPEITRLLLHLTVEDTTAPTLQSVRSENQRYITVEFSELLADTGVLDLENYHLQDTSGTHLDLLQLQSLTDLYEKRSNRTRLRFLTAPQADTTYRFFADSLLTDPAGNRLRWTTDDAQFRGNPLPDSIPPEVISYRPEHHATPTTLEIAIQLSFDEFMDTTAVENAFQLMETAGQQQRSGDFRWDNAREVTFTPTEKLEWVVQYTARLDTTATDLSGNPIERPLEWKFLPVPQD